jgi:hypothetical protein
MVIEIESITSVTCWNYLDKTPTVFEVNARQSEGAMKNEQSRETGNKTQDEDKQSKIHYPLVYDRTNENIHIQKSGSKL